MASLRLKTWILFVLGLYVAALLEFSNAQDSTTEPTAHDSHEEDHDDDDNDQILGIDKLWLAMGGLGIVIVLLFITIIIILCTMGGRRQSNEKV